MTQTAEVRADAGRTKKRRRRNSKMKAKRDASLNACTHGLRAKTFPLPHETEIVAEIGREWNAFIKPSTPAARHLTNECIRANTIADRCDWYLQAELEEQVKDACFKFHATQRARLSRARQGLSSNPEAAMEEIKSFAYGVRWTVGQHRTLVENLQCVGYLPAADLDRALLLAGVKPEPAAVRTGVFAYAFTLYNLGAKPGTDPAVIEAMLEVENRPEEMRHHPRAKLRANAENGKATLIRTFEGQIGRLQTLEEELRKTVEEPALQRAQARASILRPEASKAYARSRAEATTTFHRAWKALEALRMSEDEDDALALEEATENGVEEEGVSGGIEAVATAGAAGLPNETGNGDHQVAQVVEDRKTSGELAAAQNERTPARNGDAQEGARGALPRVVTPPAEVEATIAITPAQKRPNAPWFNAHYVPNDIISREEFAELLD